MNCRCVTNLMSAFVDGELTGTEMLEIRRHIGQCSDCRDEYESLKMTKLAIGRLRPVEPRDDFAVSIIRKLNIERIPQYQRVINVIYKYTARKLSPVVTALAASGVALAILAAGGQERILVQKQDVVANAPYSMRTHEVSIMPSVPTNSVVYSDTRPLVVAENAGGANLYLAGFSSR